MRKTGTIVDWNDAKGYGFIDSGADERQAFVHINDFPRGTRRPVEGDEVSFEEATDNRGRPKAVDARLMSYRVSFSGAQGTLITVLLVLLAVAVLAIWRKIYWIPVLYLSASLLGVLLYGLDKKAASSGGRRIPDLFLHAVGLAGGWPGALYARHLFRHKTRKIPFRIVFYIIIGFNIAGLIFFFWWKQS
jgi:uncharacterized membrane protein YsdA (DUF1294 family)/cold shock CspA family protein